MLASTTGNITGVYDMSGGAWERVAAYLDNNNGSLTSYGKSADGSVKYFEGNKLKPEYASIWDAYEVSEEERTNKIMVDGVAKTQSEMWSTDNLEQSYQEARRRITEVTFNNMAKHKGIGINEMATEFSFYAPYMPTGGTKPTRSWFKTAEQVVAGKPDYARSWDNDCVLIGHAGCPFVLRGGDCSYGSGAGVLSAHIAVGGADGASGFRPVVVL